jgi:small subunit ribosomal protein S16
MKVIRYLLTWFEVGTSGQSEAKYVAGTCYPVTEETSRHVLQGVAEEVDAPDDVEKAEAAADKAEAKADAATATAESARDAAEVAAAAAQIAAAEQPAADAPAADAPQA